MKLKKWKQRVDGLGNRIYGDDAKIVHNILTVTFVVMLCLFVYLGVVNRWAGFRHYPEETYQSIEKEAIWMIKNQNFETNVEYEIQYNNKTKELELILLPDNPVFKTTAKVTNYGQDNQMIVIERAIKNKSVLRLRWIILLAAASMLISILLYGSLAILIFIVCAIMFIILTGSEFLKKKMAEVRKKIHIKAHKK